MNATHAEQQAAEREALERRHAGEQTEDDAELFPHVAGAAADDYEKASAVEREAFAAAPGSANHGQEPRVARTSDAVRSGVGGVRLPRQAISIRQPWAWLIVNGWKNIENRMWRTSYRGPVLIHAAKGMTQDEYNACRLFMRGFCDPDRDVKMPHPVELERGGIVGVATILDCVDDHDSEWFVGEWGFVMADAKPLPFFAFKGALSFFRCDYPQELLLGGGGAEPVANVVTCGTKSGAGSPSR